MERCAFSISSLDAENENKLHLQFSRVYEKQSLFAQR